METIRVRLQKLLVENEQIMDEQSSDDLYLEWAQLAKAVSDLMDGFDAMLTLTKTCRDKQKEYFKARKANLATHTILEESKDFEKKLDVLVAQWQAQMTPPPAQTSLF